MAANKTIDDQRYPLDEAAKTGLGDKVAFGEEISRDSIRYCLEVFCMIMNTKQDLVLTFRISRIGFQQNHTPVGCGCMLRSRPTRLQHFRPRRFSIAPFSITSVPIMNLFVDKDDRESALTYVPRAACPCDRAPCFTRDTILGLN